MLAGDADARRVAGRIRQEDLRATFAADAHFRAPRSELLAARHPLLRLASATMAHDAESVHRTFRLRLRRSPSGVSPGDYLFAVVEFELKGFRPRVELEPLFWPIGGLRSPSRDEERQLFVGMLDLSDTDDTDVTWSVETVMQAVESLQAHIETTRKELMESEQSLGVVRAERRRATQALTLRGRVSAAERRVEGLQSRAAAPFAIRMADALLSKQRAALAAHEHEAPTVSHVGIERRDVAVGLLRVG